MFLKHYLNVSYLNGTFLSICSSVWMCLYVHTFFVGKSRANRYSRSFWPSRRQGKTKWVLNDVSDEKLILIILFFISVFVLYNCSISTTFIWQTCQWGNSYNLARKQKHKNELNIYTDKYWWYTQVITGVGISLLNWLTMSELVLSAHCCFYLKLFLVITALYWLYSGNSPLVWIHS